ncbi:superinfection immunity protein [Pseudomonas yamanorum]
MDRVFVMDSGNPALAFVLLALCFVIYFLPTLVASGRNHANATPIFLVNLLLGWTFLGWVVAIVWAFSANTEKPAQTGRVAPIVPSDRTCPFCAETIKSAAIKCKHCGAEVEAVKATSLKQGWVASTTCRDVEEQERTIDAIKMAGLPVVSMVGLAVGAGPYETKDEAKQARVVLRDGPQIFSEVIYRDSVSGKYPPIAD